MVPLGVHSHYSLMRGTDSPSAICRAARRMGYDRLALTDRRTQDAGTGRLRPIGGDPRHQCRRRPRPVRGVDVRYGHVPGGAGPLMPGDPEGAIRRGDRR
mgnify:CR=1 FL=1